MNGGHTPVEKKGSPLSGSCCAWSLKSTIPALLSQGCSVLINDYSHVNVLLPSSSLTSIHTMLIHNVSSFTVFECFLETLFAACETSAWFIETKTQKSTVLAALPEYCVSYTLCSYLCPCRGLIFDSLCVVQRGEQTFCLSEKLLRSSGIKICFSTCIPHKAAISVSRHWLGKFGQGIMCKWEHDSVVGKKQTNTRCLKGCITNKMVKKSKNARDDGGAWLGIYLFIPTGYVDATLMTSLPHLASSVPHDTTGLCSTESAPLCDLLLAMQDGVKGCP